MIFFNGTNFTKGQIATKKHGVATRTTVIATTSATPKKTRLERGQTFKENFYRLNI